MSSARPQSNEMELKTNSSKVGLFAFFKNMLFHVLIQELYLIFAFELVEQ
jgi:hypothetical protein